MSKEWIIITALCAGLAYLVVNTVNSIEFTLPDVAQLQAGEIAPADFNAKFVKAK